MSVTTISTSTSTLNLPYRCRCAYCGAEIRKELKLEINGYAFANSYVNEAQGQMMKMASNLRAQSNIPFELEYEEKRLEHYRNIVSSGKLKTYLETGKHNKSDNFNVEEGSALYNYLNSGANKIQAQAGMDRARLKDFAYRWKVFEKKDVVKCPSCGKIQPWCEDTGAGSAASVGFAVGIIIILLGIIILSSIFGSLQGAQILLIIIPFILGIAAGIFVYRLAFKKKLAKLVALPWNADDLPVFDKDVIAKVRSDLGKSGIS